VHGYSLFLLIVAIEQWNMHPPIEMVKSDQVAAWTYATLFVKQNLKSPSTANFGSLFGEYQDPKQCARFLGSGKMDGIGLG